MANTDNPNGFEPIYRLGGGAIPIFQGVLKSAVGLKVGDALAILTTGLLDIATASSATIAGVSAEVVTAAATATQNIRFVPALPDIVFSGQCSGTMAQTDIGEDVDIEGTTGIMEINENAVSVGVAHILGLSSYPINNAIGANARVDFVWKLSAFTGQG